MQSSIGRPTHPISRMRSSGQLPLTSSSAPAAPSLLLLQQASWKAPCCWWWSNVCLTLHASLCNTHEMSSSCNFGHRPVAMWAAPFAPVSFSLHGHSSKIPRDDFMPCHPRGAQLNAEQHWLRTPPKIQNAQLRPITLDQLINSHCTKLVVAAKGNVAGVKLLVMSNVCWTLHAPLCNTHEMFSSCNCGHRPVAMWAAPSAPTLFQLHGHSSKKSRDDFMPCHLRGGQLNAEQHWPPTPLYGEDAQLRPVTLDQLLSSRCTQLVAAAEKSVQASSCL